MFSFKNEATPFWCDEAETPLNDLLSVCWMLLGCLEKKRLLHHSESPAEEPHKSTGVITRVPFSQLTVCKMSFTYPVSQEGV